MKNNDTRKFAVGHVLSAHFKSVIRGWSDRWEVAIADLLWFLGLPIFISTALVVWFEKPLDSNSQAVFTSMAIVTGFMFNSLALTTRSAIDAELNSPIQKTYHEIVANVSSCIIFFFLSVIMWGLSALTNAGSQAQVLLSWIGYFFLSCELVTLPMVLKRMYWVGTDTSKSPKPDDYGKQKEEDGIGETYDPN